MPDLGHLIGHWGYLAIFVLVILGNMGIPLPEETILILAGYLVWQGDLRLPLVLAVGIFSAVAGDNIGYWIGREYGQGTIERYGHWVVGNPDRLTSMRGFVTRYGSLGVFAARFLPGLRFLAGPLAGATGLRPLAFFPANVLGAALYVPLAVGLGYAVGYGLGEYVARLERVVGEIEHLVLIGAILAALALMGWRALRAARARREL
ncbi:MAG: DedA family protein [candidate division NC10 bacterium]|nr:DedA family protein [candidate division NC10 bacterium]MBI2563540.1 DedA family protein [candidate division NC10 bacterium]